MRSTTAVLLAGLLFGACGGDSPETDVGQTSGDASTSTSAVDSSPGSRLAVDPNSALGLPALIGLEPVVRPETLVLSANDAAGITSVVTLNLDVCEPHDIDRVPCEFEISFTALPAGLVIGSVLASDVAAPLPYGLLAKVTAVEGSTVQATEATLSDALEQGEFVAERSFTTADVTGESLLPGVTAVPASSSLLGHGGGNVRTAPGRARLVGLAFSYSVDHVEITPGVFADGSVAFDVGCGAYGGLTYGTIFPDGVYFEAKCGVSQSGSVQVTAGYTGEANASTVIATLDLAPIVFFVAFVPIVLVPQVSVSIGVSGEFTVAMSVGASESFGVEVGIRYNDGFETIKEFNKDFSSSVVTGSGRLSAGGHVSVAESLLLYGLAGPQLTETLFLNLEGALPGAKPLWCLKGGLRAEASLVLDLGIEKLEWGPAELFTIGADLGCAENTAPVITFVSPSDGAVIYPQSSSEPPTFTVLASDPEDGAVAVSWSSSIGGDLGTTAPGQPLVGPALSLGSHTITATAIDEEGLATSASIIVKAEAGNPSLTFATKNSNGEWVPVTSISGVKDTKVVVRVGVDSHLNLGITNCSSVTWSSQLPVSAASQCDFTITLATQGSFTLTASVTDADGLAGSAGLTATVSAPPVVAVPIFSPISAKRTTPLPIVLLSEGNLLDSGETATLRVDYANYASTNVVVHYVWTVQRVFQNVPGPWTPLTGTDGSPNVFSERLFTAPTEYSKFYIYNFKVTFLNAAGNPVYPAQTFSLTYQGPFG